MVCMGATVCAVQSCTYPGIASETCFPSSVATRCRTTCATSSGTSGPVLTATRCTRGRSYRVCGTTAAGWPPGRQGDDFGGRQAAGRVLARAWWPFASVGRPDGRQWRCAVWPSALAQLSLLQIASRTVDRQLRRRLLNEVQLSCPTGAMERRPRRVEGASARMQY